MVNYNGIICVEFSPLQEIGITEHLWKKWARQPGALIRKGGNGRTSLIKFDLIPERYRSVIVEKIGKPKQTAEKNAFVDYVVADEDAKRFFATYRLENGKHLPEEHQLIYCKHAEIFNAIRIIYKNQAAARKALGSSIRGFWPKVSEVLNSIPKDELNHGLPAAHTRLQKKFNLYLNGGYIKLQAGDYYVKGYESLISKKFCHQNSAKITTEIEQWFATEMANTRLSVEMVYHTRWLQAARKNNWREDITADAFRKLAAQPRMRQMIALKRHGRKAFRQSFGQTFKLKKPLYSNDIWVSDGTAVNWYYRNGKSVEMATTYMVMDSRSKKYLGWSTKAGISKENFRMQLEAYRMAIRNSGAKPYQLLFDNQGGHKNTESRSFYSKLAKVVFPTRAYRPSGKPIERAFGDFQTLILAEFPFWSGFGRPSHATVEYRPNMEDIMKNMDNLPTYEEIVQLFEIAVNKWNNLNFNGAGSPNEIYASSINPDQEPITLDELSELFWDIQGPKKYGSQGITLRINGEDALYEVYTAAGDLDYEFRRNYLHQRFFIKYDPELEVTDIELYQDHGTGGLQKIATASPSREVSRSVKYHEEGDVEWINKQMALEAKMLDDMDTEMETAGYNDEKKWQSWRDLLDTKTTKKPAFPGLYTSDDEGSMEVVTIQ